MFSKSIAQGYDLFKLLIALILFVMLVFFYTFLRNAGTPVAEVTATPTLEPTHTPTPITLPSPTPQPPIPLPEPSAGLIYDSLTRCIVNSVGEPLYCLNEDDTLWVPVVPYEIAVQFPAQVDPLLKEDGQWIIPGENLDVIFYWEYSLHAWILVVRQQQPTTGNTDCPGSLSPQFQAGDKARVATNLNFRTSPGLLPDNWIRTNLAGTILTILGETACTPYDFGAYRWWRVQMENGDIGWSAEGSATGNFYFLVPTK